jgi:hypothetical protein
MVNMSLDHMNLLPASTHGKYVFRPYMYLLRASTHGKYVFRPYVFVTSLYT